WSAGTVPEVVCARAGLAPPNSAATRLPKIADPPLQKKSRRPMPLSYEMGDMIFLRCHVRRDAPTSRYSAIYSITSSARASSMGGISMPSVAALIHALGVLDDLVQRAAQFRLRIAALVDRGADVPQILHVDRAVIGAVEFRDHRVPSQMPASTVTRVGSTFSLRRFSRHSTARSSLSRRNTVFGQSISGRNTAEGHNSRTVA